MEDSTLRIIEGAAEFLWSEEIQNSLDTFATNHAPMFSDCTSAQDEQRLEWGEAHKDFQALVELHLERFLGTQSISAEEFVQACQDALDHGSWANCRGVVEVVLSMTTYEHFLQMMIAAAEPDPFDRSFSTRLDAFDDPDEEEGAAVGEEDFM